MRWLKRTAENRWVMRNRHGDIVDSVTQEEIKDRPRRQRAMIERAPEDDGRFDT